MRKGPWLLAAGVVAALAAEGLSFRGEDLDALGKRQAVRDVLSL